MRATNRKESEKMEETEKNPDIQEETPAEENTDEKDNSNECDDISAKISELESKLNDSEDKYLRLFAEYDNFRKRTSKEKIEAFGNATAKCVENILPVMDSFERAIIAECTDEAYKNGMTVAPLISNIDIADSIVKLERGFDNNYLDWLKCDISIVTIQGGVTHTGVATVRGYMQERAKRGKSTIIFTNAKIDMYMMGLLCSENNESCLHLARYISVEYISKKNNENTEDIDKSINEDSNNSGKSIVTMEELMRQNF